VLTSAGIISNVGKIFFHRVDRYEVIRKESVDSQKLQTLRACILDEHFYPRFVKKTWIVAAYKKEYVLEMVTKHYDGCIGYNTVV
jgi:hypothetical protein